MKELMKKIFIGRSVLQKQRILEDSNTLMKGIFNGFDINGLIKALDDEFKKNNGGYSSDNALTIVNKLRNLNEDLSQHSQSIKTLLTSLNAEIEKSIQLNTEDAQKLKQKREALIIEARYDWYGKFRTFLFSAMGAVLFIVTLFTIGYIEKNYDWAVLPLAKYVEVSSEKLTSHNVSDLKVTSMSSESAGNNALKN